jgi:hypothetical protein
MGKFKSNSKKSSSSRVDPLRSASETNAELDRLNAKLPELAAKLSSLDAEERELSCRTFANTVISDAPATFALLAKHNVLEQLIARLVDTHRSVRIVACGALRNAFMSGGDAFCQRLVELNCITPLLVALKKAHDEATHSNSADSNGKLGVWQFYSLENK